ncbi:hypothetical protein I315_06279 [Cryptococcus gattii Ru294]|nr:hypothetical protein I315_06279 [Cryptococcus gattii Ru294]
MIQGRLTTISVNDANTSLTFLSALKSSLSKPTWLTLFPLPFWPNSSNLLRRVDKNAETRCARKIGRNKSGKEPNGQKR